MGSVIGERVKLVAEKAAMIAEVEISQKQHSLALQKLRLEQQERFPKLKTEITRTEVKEKVYDNFNVIKEDDKLLIQPPDQSPIIARSLRVRPREDLNIINEEIQLDPILHWKSKGN